MNYFPVISSTLSPHHLARLVEKTYNTGIGTSCRLLKAGINHTYLITGANERFIFRIYSLDWRTEKEISEEIRLLNILKDNAIPVSFALPDASGRYIQQFDAPEGMRYGVMFSYADGEKMLNYPPEIHRQIGTIMARMHTATKSLTLERTTYTSEVLLIDSMNYLKPFLPENCEEISWMHSAQKYLTAEFAKADTTQIRQGAVHLDLWFDNINIGKNGQVTVFDFDFCGNGWLCMDIAYYILQLHSTEKDEPERNIRIAKFFEGYQSILPITDEEKRIIPMLGVSLYFFYLGVQSQRYDNWSNVFFNEVHIKRYIMLLVKKYFDTSGLG